MRAVKPAALAAIVLAAGCADPSTTERPASDTDPGHRRVERAIDRAWESYCHSDDCGVASVVELSVTTPESVALVDVTLTATVEYRVHSRDASTGVPRDWGAISAAYGDEPPGFANRMNPGSFALRASTYDDDTTTTLTWTKGRVPAEGRTYYFSLFVATRDGNGDGWEEISGDKVAAVAELWPTGP